MNFRIDVAIACFMLLCSCSPKQTGKPIPDRDIAKLYAELLLLSETSKATPTPMTAEAYRQKTDSILQAHKTTKEDFIGAIQALSNNQETFRVFYEEVASNAQQLSKKP